MINAKRPAERLAAVSNVVIYFQTNTILNCKLKKYITPRREANYHFDFDDSFEVLKNDDETKGLLEVEDKTSILASNQY